MSGFPVKFATALVGPLEDQSGFGFCVHIKKLFYLIFGKT